MASLAVRIGELQAEVERLAEERDHYAKAPCRCAEVERLREALRLIADKPFAAALDAREMQDIAEAALMGRENP